jgi:hypothetical protein
VVLSPDHRLEPEQAEQHRARDFDWPEYYPVAENVLEEQHRQKGLKALHVRAHFVMNALLRQN